MTRAGELDLAAIKARLAAATPGPWLTPNEAGDPYLVTVIDHEGCHVWPWDSEASMEFAYKAREDVPALVEEVEALREALGELADNMEQNARESFDTTMLGEVDRFESDFETEDPDGYRVWKQARAALRGKP